MKVNRSLVFVSLLGLGCLLAGTLLRAQESGYSTIEGVAEYMSSTPPSRLVIQPASRTGNSGLSIESAYLRSGDRFDTVYRQSPGMDGEDSWRAVRLQLASAIREQDTVALQRLTAFPYGENSALDGLLIEGLRTIGRRAEPSRVEFARSRLVSFLEEELQSSAESLSVGRLIHIIESFRDFPGEESQSELIFVLEDRSLPRPVRASAAGALVSMRAPNLSVSIKAFREELASSIERNEIPEDEVPFVRATINEMNQLLQQL